LAFATLAYGDDGRCFAQTVAFEHGDADGVEEGSLLLLEGGSTGYDDVEVAADGFAPFTIDQFVGKLVFEFVPG